MNRKMAEAAFSKTKNPQARSRFVRPLSPLMIRIDYRSLAERWREP
jgi:hypothetical protein